MVRRKKIKANVKDLMIKAELKADIKAKPLCKPKPKPKPARFRKLKMALVIVAAFIFTGVSFSFYRTSEPPPSFPIVIKTPESKITIETSTANANPYPEIRIGTTGCASRSMMFEFSEVKPE